MQQAGPPACAGGCGQGREPEPLVLAVDQWTEPDDSESQVLQPDVITETVPLPPYGACEGISDNPTGDYTGSCKNTGAGALPYNVASKSAFNCTTIINYE